METQEAGGLNMLQIRVQFPRTGVLKGAVCNFYINKKYVSFMFVKIINFVTIICEKIKLLPELPVGNA